MTLECPKCKSPVARDGQRFCYRCGQELNAYYDSLKVNVAPSGPSDPLWNASSSAELPAETPPPPPKMPVSTVVLEANAFGASTQTPPETPPSARLTILLPTGDVFDRELSNTETQIGKGPRNDIVIADPAVSTAHAMVRLEGGAFTINDIGSRNGTFVNGERISEPRRLAQGDLIGIGLSKLTFRVSDYSDTIPIDRDELAAASRRAAPPPLTEESLALAVSAAGLVSKADVDRVRGDGKGRRLYQALVEERLASEESLRDLLSKTFEIPTIDLNSVQFDDTVVAQIPAKLARELQAFPVAKEGESLILAVTDPTNVEGVERLRREVRTSLSIRLATPTQIRERVDRHYGPKLIGVLPSGDKLEYLIDKHEVEIGKAAHNHIVLTDPTVSNTHAIVIARDAGYTIVDLGSRNGTFVNGDRLGAQAHTLKHGDKVQLGQTVLTFRNPAETSASMTTVLSGEALEEVRRRAGVSAATPEEGQSTAEKVSAEKTPAVQATSTPGLGSVSAPEVIAPTPPSSEGGAPVEVAAGDDKDEKKKKKKKKKKDKDARLKAAYVSAWGRVLAAVLSVALTVALTLYLTRSSSGPNKEEIKISKKGHAKLKVPKATSGTPFQGGAFEASGVVQVIGSSAVLFVDDTKLDEILWMQVDESGKQKGAVKPIPLGASVADLEGITYGDGYFYVIGSQSDPKDGDQNAIARFKFDAASQTIKETEVIPNLRNFLVTNVPELKGDGEKSGKEGGLNIEGIGWDPKRNRLLLGLRSPQSNGNALIVPIALSNPGGTFSIDNVKVLEAHAILLPLEGLGIRDIQYDSRLDSFLIIAGAPEHHEKKLGFKLWQWSGDPASSEPDSGLRALTDLDTGMKPEGITHFEFEGRDFIFIVGDASAYTKLDYTETE